MGLASRKTCAGGIETMRIFSSTLFFSKISSVKSSQGSKNSSTTSGCSGSGKGSGFKGGGIIDLQGENKQEIDGNFAVCYSPDNKQLAAQHTEYRSERGCLMERETIKVLDIELSDCEE